MNEQITRTEQITDGLPTIMWTISDEDGIAAELVAHTSGLIMMVDVRADRQREGLATRLYLHADAEHGLYHVPVWGRSFEGNRWADAVGGDTMDDQQACDILGLDLDVVTGAFFAA